MASRLLGGSAIILVGNIFGLGAVFLSRLFAARYLGPDGYGLLVLGFTMHSILVLIVLLGFQDGLAREMSREENPTPLVSSAFVISFSLSAILGVALFLLRGHVSDVIGIPAVTPILGVFGITLPAITLLEFLKAVFRGYEDARGRVLVENFIRQGLGLLAIIGGVIIGADTLTIAYLWGGSILLATVFAIPVATRRIPLGTRVENWVGSADTGTAIRLTKYSIPLMASGTIWQLMQYSDNYLLAYFLSNQSEVGVYDAAFTFGKLLIIGATTVQYLLVPMLSGLHAEGKMQEFQKLYQQSTRWIVLLTLPAYLLLVGFADIVLVNIYGGGYEGGAIILAVILTGFMLHILLGTNGGALNAVGRTRMIFASNLVAFFGNVVLNIILIPVYGILGAAAASAAAYALVNLAYSLTLYAHGEIHPVSIPELKSGLVSVTLFVLGYQVFSSQIDSVVQFSLFALVYLIAHLGIAFRLGVTDEEWGILQRYVRGVQGKVEGL
ncbi:oligosaccharide flippase family protein [Halobacterium salinarum]|uniref:oligosaccharide flippase family protein n=1 Tax=Halobacterium salinarum TaxID=2242 RepID=UPI00255415DA|nr:oligosaccharide flippase family protein [Halobacterium salinarum]MDL0138876.1 oligosaccharide flippase family protein [Halobacterium salinarum]